MKIDNNIGQRVKLNDEYLKETYLGYAFPTIRREHSFLFVADEPNETFHDGAIVVDEYQLAVIMTMEITFLLNILSM